MKNQITADQISELIRQNKSGRISKGALQAFLEKGLNPFSEEDPRFTLVYTSEPFVIPKMSKFKFSWKYGKYLRDIDFSTWEPATSIRVGELKRIKIYNLNTKNVSLDDCIAFLKTKGTLPNGKGLAIALSHLWGDLTEGITYTETLGIDEKTHLKQKDPVRNPRYYSVPMLHFGEYGDPYISDGFGSEGLQISYSCVNFVVFCD